MAATVLMHVFGKCSRNHLGKFTFLKFKGNITGLYNGADTQGVSQQLCRSASGGPVGFIGLGNMGGPMAVNLATKGKYNLLLYDVNKENIDKVLSSCEGSGCTAGSSPSDVASQCRTIVTMLPSNPHVREVYCNPDTGILRSALAGSLLIDSSTIEPALAQEVGRAAENKSATYMDAPVSGGVLAARDALLTFMVGGPRFEDAKTYLQHMGKKLIHCGEAVGTGEAAKICNNMLLAISMIGVSETMHLGIKLGLSPTLLASVLNSSSGRCWSSDTYNPCPRVMSGVPSSRGYEGGFGTALMTKDLMLAQSAATSTACPTPLGAAAFQIYKLMCQHNLGGKDFSVIYRYLSESDGDAGNQG